MVLKVHNVTKWRVLEPGQVLTLTGADGEARKVRVELNCVEVTRVDWVAADGRVWFLGIVHGYEVVEFTTYDGDSQLVFTTEGDVWYFTNDGDQVGVDRSMESESFATVMQRRARNPQLELMLWKMNQNIERRLAQQAAEIERLSAANREGNADEPEVGGGAGDGDAGSSPAEASAAADGEQEGAEPETA